MKNAINWLKKIIQNNELLAEETKINFFTLSQWSPCYALSHQVYGKEGFNIGIWYSKNGKYGYEKSLKKEAVNLFWTIFERQLKNSKYLKRKKDGLDIILKKIYQEFELAKTSLHTLSNQELLRFFDKITYLGRRQYSYSIVSESADFLEMIDYQDILGNLPQNEVIKIIETLSLPVRFSNLEKEKISLYKLALLLNKNDFKDISSNKRFNSSLLKHTKSYFWIRNDFYGVIDLKSEDFLVEIKTILKRYTKKQIKRELEKILKSKRVILVNQKKIIKRYRLSKKTRIFFEILRIFTAMQEKRKESVQKLIYIFYEIFKILGEKYKVGIKELEFYKVEDIRRLIKFQKKLKKLEVRNRRPYLIASYYDSRIRTLLCFGNPAKDLIKFIEDKEKTKKVKTIFGFTASLGKKPKVVGQVRIVLDPQKARNFKEGDILVAGMTRPEYVPLMKKALAVITNEGGITSHASIVSRELKIPCIIGTKIATRVLRDGDRVEVDANKGIVRKL
jgi:phosphohistidine swiveling domain-containing protein